MTYKIVLVDSAEDVHASMDRASECFKILRAATERMHEIGASGDQIANVLRVAADGIDGADTADDGAEQRKALRAEEAEDLRADFRIAEKDEDGGDA
jgi:hypothetical protein